MRMLDLIFGHRHRLSFPITLRRRTYRTCVECGKEYEYDFEAMRVVKEVKKARKLAPVIEIGEFRRIARSK